MCVQRRRFDVNLIVTCEGSNGLINALLRLTSFESKPTGGGEPAEPTTGRKGGDKSFSRTAFHGLSTIFRIEGSRTYSLIFIYLPSLFPELGDAIGLVEAAGIVIACDLVGEFDECLISGSDSFR